MKIAEAVAIKNLMRQSSVFFAAYADKGQSPRLHQISAVIVITEKMKTAGREEPGLKERKENIYDKKNSTGNVTSTYRGVLPMGCR